jgi:hypothetical protein
MEEYVDVEETDDVMRLYILRLIIRYERLLKEPEHGLHPVDSEKRGF